MVARERVTLLKEVEPVLVPEAWFVPVLAVPPDPRAAKPTASGLENRYAEYTPVRKASPTMTEGEFDPVSRAKIAPKHCRPKVSTAPPLN